MKEGDQLPSYDVGICATGDSPEVSGLVGRVFSDELNIPLALESVVVVASGCPKSVERELLEMAGREARLQVVAEPWRSGKAAAINQILERTRGKFLVLVNSDAHPESGAVAKVLATISADDSVGVVSAEPVPLTGNGPASLLSQLEWSAHNQCSMVLNHMGISNHGSDELIVLRRSAVSTLPRGLVNDGAFLAGTARRRGFSVRFNGSARVAVETPSRVSDLIGQRRRILFGHREVWRILGTPPRNIESLLLLRPKLGLALLVRTFAGRPRLLAALPIALVVEPLAAALSVWDSLVESRRHEIWRRYR